MRWVRFDAAWSHQVYNDNVCINRAARHVNDVDWGNN